MNKLIHSCAQYFRHITNYFEMFSEKKIYCTRETVQAFITRFVANHLALEYFC